MTSRVHRLLSAAVAAAVVVAVGAFGLHAAGAGKSAAELEKEKAMQNPYPNDLGPETVDVSGYPKEAQEGYTLLKSRCAQCHTAARPLNSRFVEPDAEKDKRESVVADLKKSAPDLFKDYSLHQIEAGVWQRYVKRMMAKPGCKISPAEGKKIYKFLTVDSSKRKLGANAKKWAEHRKKLIEDFKKAHPERYKELHEAKDL
ncbi:MAG: hypothetical protein HY554_10545 [Elusimicrobia bacterium]|nr:hypothetical protein [Elusimicrobiota bacterium]